MKLKILHVVFCLDPGGMENGVTNLSRGLDANLFQIDVCCLSNSGVFSRRLPPHSQVYALNKAPGLQPSLVFKLAHLFSKVSPDVLHTHNLGPLFYASLATSLGKSIPILHGEHGSLQPPDRVLRRMMMRKILYGHCRKVHTVSSSLTNELVDLGFPPNKILTLINGVDTDLFVPPEETKEKSKESIGYSKTDFVIGIVGRFAEYKGHDLLLKAFEQLAHTDNNLQLLMVGAGGSREEEINKMVKESSCCSRVRMVGFQNFPLPYYQAMDVQVFPSSKEGMSNALLESMSAGVPVLGNEACGNSEVITHNQDGILAEINSVENLAKILESVISNPNFLKKLGTLARAKIVEKFSILNMFEKYTKAYLAIAS